MTIKESVALTALRRRLKLFAESFAECEYCGKFEICDSACDLRHDKKGKKYQLMLDARLALYGALE